MSYGLTCASICTICPVAKAVTVIDLYLNLAGSHYSTHYIFLLHGIHCSVGTAQAHAQLHICIFTNHWQWLPTLTPSISRLALAAMLIKQIQHFTSSPRCSLPLASPVSLALPACPSRLARSARPPWLQQQIRLVHTPELKAQARRTSRAYAPPSRLQTIIQAFSKTSQMDGATQPEHHPPAPEQKQPLLSSLSSDGNNVKQQTTRDKIPRVAKLLGPLT
jgi:hypothetical protein